jgi:uncharacterized membrane protein
MADCAIPVMCCITKYTTFLALIQVYIRCRKKQTIVFQSDVSSHCKKTKFMELDISLMIGWKKVAAWLQMNS